MYLFCPVCLCFQACALWVYCFRLALCVLWLVVCALCIEPSGLQFLAHCLCIVAPACGMCGCGKSQSPNQTPKATNNAILKQEAQSTNQLEPQNYKQQQAAQNKAQGRKQQGPSTTHSPTQKSQTKRTRKQKAQTMSHKAEMTAQTYTKTTHEAGHRIHKLPHTTLQCIKYSAQSICHKPHKKSDEEATTNQKAPTRTTKHKSGTCKMQKASQITNHKVQGTNWN